MTSKFVMVSSWGACFGSNMDTIPILVLGFFFGWVGGFWGGDIFDQWVFFFLLKK
jgi:thiamine transporter ThiT